MNLHSDPLPGHERYIGILFAVIGGLIAPLMPFVSRAPTIMALLGAIGGTALLWRRGMRPTVPDRQVLWILASLSTWAGLSAFWAIDAIDALASTAKLAGNLSLGMVLIVIAANMSPAEARIAARSLAAGCILTLAFLAVEMTTGAPASAHLVGRQFDADRFAFELQTYGAYWFNAAISLLSLMVWPLLLNGGRLPAAVRGILPIATAWLALVIGFGAGTLALAAGATSAFLVWRYGRWIRRVAAALLAVGILAAPLLPQTILNPERMSEMSDVVPTYDLPRFYIWAFAADRIAERPILGWGMNASRSMPGGKERIIDHARDKMFGERMPLHPHNVALQVWLELGMFGALLLAGLAARLMLPSTATPQKPQIAAAATGLTITAGVQFALSYSAWQSWWLMSVFLAATFLTISARAIQADTPRMS